MVASDDDEYVAEGAAAAPSTEAAAPGAQAQAQRTLEAELFGEDGDDSDDEQGAARDEGLALATKKSSRQSKSELKQRLQRLAQGKKAESGPAAQALAALGRRADAPFAERREEDEAQGGGPRRRHAREKGCRQEAAQVPRGAACGARRCPRRRGRCAHC